MLYPCSLPASLSSLSLSPCMCLWGGHRYTAACAGRNPRNTRPVFVDVCSNASRWKLSCEAICMIIEKQWELVKSLSLSIYTKLDPERTGVYSFVVDACGSGSIYMEGRERLSWIKPNSTALTVSFYWDVCWGFNRISSGHRQLWNFKAGVFPAIACVWRELLWWKKGGVQEWWRGLKLPPWLPYDPPQLCK